MTEQEFESNFFSSPPSDLLLDITGLVESQVMAAEDWLTRYDGPDGLTAAEAFEGIECLFRLIRTRPGLLSDVGGDSVLAELQSTIGSNAERFATLALQFPNVDAWLAQFDWAWDIDSEDAQQAIILLQDAEAINAVLWFCAIHGFEDDFAADSRAGVNESLTVLAEGRNKIQLQLGRRGGFFILCEGHVRATCETIRTDWDNFDSTGWMPLSAAMYLPLLQAADEVWNDDAATTVFSPPQWKQYSSPLGGMAMDYARVPVMASAAGAEIEFRPATRSFAWYSPARNMMAEMYLPSGLKPAGDTPIRIEFYADREGTNPADTLVGQTVALGNASGTIVDLRHDRVPSVSATLVYEQITSGSGQQIRLTVAGEVWIHVDD